MYCDCQEDPYILSYLAFMSIVCNTMLRHDFQVCIAHFFSISLQVSPALQQALHVAGCQSAQLELLYHIQSGLPPQLNFPWLFLAIDILLFCELYLRGLMSIEHSKFVVPSWPHQNPSYNPSNHQKSFASDGGVQHVCPYGVDQTAPYNLSNHKFKSFYGGGAQHVCPFEVVEPHIFARANDINECTFRFVDYVSSTGLLAYPVDQNFVHADIPLQDILPHLSLKMGHKIACLHHIIIGSHVAKSDFINYFDNHSCISCNLYSSVFVAVKSKTLKDRICKHTITLNLNKKIIYPDDKIHCAKYENTHCEQTHNNVEGTSLPVLSEENAEGTNLPVLSQRI